MKIRYFGNKDELRFWSDKPLQDGHPDLQMPMGGEQWEIEYGMPTNTEHKATGRCCSYECVYVDSRENITVQGSCFKHRIR
jgi:hypothetical protein